MRGLTRVWSLQARLMAWVLGMVSVVWVCAAALTWYDALQEIDELMDGNLAQVASLLILSQPRGDEDDSVVAVPATQKYAQRVAFQVFHGGQLVMHSDDAGTQRLVDLTDGFADVARPDGTRWRVFAASDAQNKVQVYVAEQPNTRDDILELMLRNVLWPLAIALPLLALAVAWAVRLGIAPLRQLSEQLRQRQPQALETIAFATLPREIQSVVQALNALFARIGAMLESERRFTADAAHELRTPIAAIRIQAQVALGAGGDTAQLHQALEHTLAGCDRATRLVEQLLMLARLEAAPSAAAASVDLVAVVRRIAAEVAPLALARDQILELYAAGPALLSGDEVLLGVLVRNLIDNAVRYSPPGAQIAVSVERVDGCWSLQVQDSGPGMAEHDMARLGERFYRALGNELPGSGLGWSIINRVAAVSGARVVVGRSRQWGGLAVQVQWPGAELRK